MASVNGSTPGPCGGRVYGGQTEDERVSERRQALVSAAFEIVAEGGWRALKIDAVCRAAGLNKRYFYESFDGADAVIGAVTSQLADEAIAVTLAAITAEMPPDVAVRAGIGVFVTHLTDDPRRARVLFGAVPAGEAAAGHQADAIRQVIATAAATGRSLHEGAADVSVAVAAPMLVGGTSQVVLDWLDGRVNCTQAELVDEVVMLWQTIGDAVAARTP